MKLTRLSPLLTALLAALAASCASDPPSTEVGNARMSLATTSASGVDYRLRDAVFDLTGPQEVSVLSETYPGSEGTIIVPLATGEYSVALRDGFRMEYSTDDLLHNWTEISAELTSQNPTEVTIVTSETTSVLFAFRVNGNLITFGGELGIEIAVDDNASRCAPHFVEIPGAEVPMCSGGGYMGPDPILETYGCTLESDYPPPGSCPNGMLLNNTLGSGFGGAPYFTCYVAQDVYATFAPAGCPIAPATVACPTGFAVDMAHSRLTWGMGSSWGCYFACAMSPDPTAGTGTYPCAADGFDAIGGGGGGTCCARW